jgi:glycosyltransferase involved in cell wall biosynthesis
MRVQIDGVEYVRGDKLEPSMDVAIAITTRNRHQVLAQTLKQIELVTPDAVPVFIVDDGSDPPVADQLSDRHKHGWFRFDQNVGIPRAKNKCIELCMRTTADHFFLLDDDCYPIVENWWLPYVCGAEQHYSYIFTHWESGGAVGDCNEIYNDGRVRAFSHSRGCAMYLTRAAVEKVGGFDPAFGLGMEEHLEYSRRINNAGLTTFAFQDVVDSERIWYSIDRARTGTGTIPLGTRAELLKRNRPLSEERKDSRAYVEYRDLPNIVVTQLLTSVIDPQRAVKLRPDADLIRRWSQSITGGDPIALVDEMPTDIGSGGRPLEFVLTGKGWKNPYFQRWLVSLRYLREHPAKWVWLTDGTDVEMLREPWDEMTPGILYAGYEPDSVANPWLAQHHQFYADWIATHRDLQLLNCGVIGGDHATVLEFLQDMVRELSRAYGQIDYEMGSFNYLLHQPKWAERMCTGPTVVTLFRADERGGRSWWKHK